MISPSKEKEYEKIVKEAENEELIESGLTIPESEVFTEETMQLIEEAKKKNQNAFHSYWEYDENDIDVWSKKQIDEDPAKQLVTYAETGNLSDIKLLISQYNKEPKEIEKMLMFKDSDGYTALHRAAYSNSIEVVKYLTSFEDNSEMPLLNQLEARTDMGWTPLHSAVYWNSYQVVEYLLKYLNADPNLKSNSGQTCLHLAAQQSNIRETLLLLLTSPFINFSIKNDQGESALEIATRSSKYNALYEITQDNLNKL